MSFGAGIVTARSFGAKNKYPVDANRELVGFGAANVASGLFGGFAVTASDSRTAINDSMGGKTQLAGIVSAAALALAVLFLSDALSLLPTPALGAVLASAAVSLIDLRTLRELWRISRIEFAFALISIAGVIVLGVLNGVVVAVGATLLYLLMKGLWPRDAMLGRIPGREGFYKLHRYPNAQPIPGLAIYLLQGNLLFFNVDYVKGRLEDVIANLAPGTEWLIFDAGSTAQIDSTAVVMLDDVRTLAEERGLKFAIRGTPPRAARDIGSLRRRGQDRARHDLRRSRGCGRRLLGKPTTRFRRSNERERADDRPQPGAPTPIVRPRAASQRTVLLKNDAGVALMISSMQAHMQDDIVAPHAGGNSALQARPVCNFEQRQTSGGRYFCLSGPAPRAAGEFTGSALGGGSPAEDRPAYLAAGEACRRQETIERWLVAR